MNSSDASHQPDDKLVLEEDHLSDGILIAIALLIPVPWAFIAWERDPTSLVVWGLAGIGALLIFELPYFLFLCCSWYRRAEFGPAGVETRLIYRLWGTREKHYAWDEIASLRGKVLGDSEGPDMLYLYLTPVGGREEWFLIVEARPQTLASLARICGEKLKME